jgi:hypothetical protein
MPVSDIQEQKHLYKSGSRNNMSVTETQEYIQNKNKGE